MVNHKANLLYKNFLQVL